MNLRNILCTGGLAVVAMAFALTAPAQTQTLVITENSSTSISVLLNGVSQDQTVVLYGPDNWYIGLSGILGYGIWQEPGSPATVNNLIQAHGGNVLIESDLYTYPAPTGTYANGATDPNWSINGAPLDFTFTDLSDVQQQPPQQVPDGASTFFLLALSAAGLEFAAKFKTRFAL